MMIKFLTPIFILVFLLLFIYATTLYPGGSDYNPNKKGFDWIHNYWCNVVSEEAKNGEINSARPYAIFATMMLALGFSIFFYRFSSLVEMSDFWSKSIAICGVISMILACFIFTKFHNVMILLSSIFGLVALVGIIKALINHNWNNLLWMGIGCGIILVIVNFIYYTDIGVIALPFLQKISLLCILLYVAILNYYIEAC